MAREKKLIFGGGNGIYLSIVGVMRRWDGTGRDGTGVHWMGWDWIGLGAGNHRSLSK